MRALVLIAALCLSACAGQPLTRGQSIYSAYGHYNEVLKGARDYAVSPTADPFVVRKINQANQSQPVRTAVAFGRAYVACSGNPNTLSADPAVICRAWDFSRPSTYAIALREAAAVLLRLTVEGAAR